MARVFKKPIIIDADVKTDLNQATITVTGPKGNLEINLPASVKAEISNNQLVLVPKFKSADMSIIGLYNSLIKNAIIGVKEGWNKTLELVGVGFRASTTGSELILNVGFTHPVKIKAPEGISFQVTDNKVVVTGIDKYLVGETAASIRRVKPPEPYKGKGIRYLGEVIRKKAGKAAKTVGGTGVK